MANDDSAQRAFDWNLLHVFVVLAESRSITHAAERLGRTQSTVSSALARLEASLGKPLLERGPRAFVLTAAGQALYREAVELSGAVERLPMLLRDDDAEIQGHIRLAITNHVVSPVLDRYLSMFFKSFPQVTLTLDVMTSRAAEAEVRARRATLAICITECADPVLAYQHLYTERFGLFCGPGHALFGANGLTLNALWGHAAVSFITDRLDGVLRSVAIVKAEAGLDRNVVAQSSDLQEIRRLTLLGIGISALPVHVVASDVASGRLWRLPPYDAPPEIDVSIVTNPKSHLDRAETAFIDGLLDERRRATAAETQL